MSQDKLMSDEEVKTWADTLSMEDLKKIVGEGGQAFQEEEREARKWHRDPYITADMENKSKLAGYLNKRLYEEKIAEAKSAVEAPEMLLIPHYVNDTYGEYANILYIKGENGEYLKTRIGDELHFDCEEYFISDNQLWHSSQATDGESVKANDRLISTVNDGIYKRDKNGKFVVLENDTNSTYKVLGKSAYWRDDNNGENSVLVVENPISGKFEDIPYAVNRYYGNYIVAHKYENKGENTTVYGRGEDGSFVPVADFPALECTSAFIDSGDVELSYLNVKTKESFSFRGNKKGKMSLKMRSNNSDEYKTIALTEIERKQAENNEVFNRVTQKLGDRNNGEIVYSTAKGAKKATLTDIMNKKKQEMLRNK